MRYIMPVCFFLFCTFFTGIIYGQDNGRTFPDRCGTMQTLEAKLQANPRLRTQFEDQRNRFNTTIRDGMKRLSDLENGNRTMITVPVVFHVVLTNPLLVTDQQVQAQLDTLNKDYAGVNGDSVKIPAYFKPLFGKSGIQFCLAKQTPSGEPTNGIDRVITTKTSFLNTDDGVKHASTGGANAWDPSSYFNVWLCPLANGILGYGTFPGGSNENEQGVVVDYRSLPGGSYASYSGGKTLTHESGHYFNLYHIWGDDSGGCNGTDFVDDTPNQGNSNSVCPSGIKTDNCTATGNGIMYQNYMDYTYDECLVMFTTQQVDRMEAALNAFRPSLLTSIACQSPLLYNVDAQLRSINLPAQRICSNTFSPLITITNRGQQAITALTITALLDNTTTTTSYTGNLAALASADVTLNAVTVTTGIHTLKITLLNPNNTVDQNNINDTLTINFQYYPPVSTLSESFEGGVFPPLGWDIVNPDNGLTWQKATGIAKTGNSSAMINNFNYSVTGQQDYLRLPNASIPVGTDSAFFSFQVAAATYTSVNAANNAWDTLEVLISTDCGKTYASLYKKWGSSLVTHTAALTSAFVPTAAEWRKDSINISNYIGSNQFLLAFKNTTATENNIYIDDVNLRTVTVNPNLKSRGFLVTPSPTKGPVTVQFYPQPTDIKSIAIFSMNGQKVAEIIPNGQSNNYVMDISRYSSGVYMVRVVMGNNVVVKKIVKD